MYLKNAACLSLSLQDVPWPQEGWQQLEGKQEPDDSAPAVRSGGFWVALDSQANSGGKLSFECFAPVFRCFVWTGALQGSGQVAAAVRVLGGCGGVQPSSP